jgi:peptidoglycan/xylan/chitin deacetylase (PgdA/CDA1 family)
VALAVLVLAAAGVGAGIVLSGGGGSMKAQPTTASRTPVRAAPLPSPRPRKAPKQSSLARLIRIGLPVFCGGPRGRDVALTFDDGPGPYTSLALRILRRAHARATFFLVGHNLARWPDLPRQELELAALGDHTWTHPDLLLLPRSQMESQLATTQGAVARAGDRRVQLFRPPYGAHDAAVDAETHRLGMLEVLWSVDSADSAGANYEQIQRLVLHRIRPGSIVLMHENRGQTIRALKFFILPALRRRGLHPVTVPELMVSDPPSIARLRAGRRGCYPRQTSPAPAYSSS